MIAGRKASFGKNFCTNCCPSSSNNICLRSGMSSCFLTRSASSFVMASCTCEIPTQWEQVAKRKGCWTFKAQGFDFRYWSCLGASGKLIISRCFCPPSSHGYIMELKFVSEWFKLCAFVLHSLRMMGLLKCVLLYQGRWTTGKMWLSKPDFLVSTSSFYQYIMTCYSLKFFKYYSSINHPYAIPLKALKFCRGILLTKCFSVPVYLSLLKWNSIALLEPQIWWVCVV